MTFRTIPRRAIAAVAGAAVILTAGTAIVAADSGPARPDPVPVEIEQAPAHDSTLESASRTRFTEVIAYRYLSASVAAYEIRASEVQTAREAAAAAERARLAAQEAPTAPAYAPAPVASSGSGSCAIPQPICDRESGGDPNAWNPAGYWGKYQFAEGTWNANCGGGWGSASEAVQDACAVKVYDGGAGAGHWGG